MGDSLSERRANFLAFDAITDIQEAEGDLQDVIIER